MNDNNNYYSLFMKSLYFNKKQNHFIFHIIDIIHNDYSEEIEYNINLKYSLFII